MPEMALKWTYKSKKNYVLLRPAQKRKTVFRLRRRERIEARTSRITDPFLFDIHTPPYRTAITQQPFNSYYSILYPHILPKETRSQKKWETHDRSSRERIPTHRRKCQQIRIKYNPNLPCYLQIPHHIREIRDVCVLTKNNRGGTSTNHLVKNNK